MLIKSAEKRIIDEKPEILEEPMKMVYDVFNVPTAKVVEAKRTSSRKESELNNLM